jgi:hypothetical protein
VPSPRMPELQGRVVFLLILEPARGLVTEHVHPGEVEVFRGLQHVLRGVPGGEYSVYWILTDGSGRRRAVVQQQLIVIGSGAGQGDKSTLQN